MKLGSISPDIKILRGGGFMLLKFWENLIDNKIYCPFKYFMMVIIIVSVLMPGVYGLSDNFLDESKVRVENNYISDKPGFYNTEEITFSEDYSGITNDDYSAKNSKLVVSSGDISVLQINVTHDEIIVVILLYSILIFTMPIIFLISFMITILNLRKESALL
ncbi:MAG: hypothetical protein KAW93_04845 [Methanogenium sp.]|nr:hypothetical protein [Methanogenium sp.]